MLNFLCIPCNSVGWLKRRLESPFAVVGRTPPLQRYEKYHSAADDRKGASGIAGCCIAVNVIMGSGFLALPAAFVDAGWLLSLIVLLVSCCIIMVTVNYEIEVMCRAEAILHQKLVPEEVPVSHAPRRKSLSVQLSDSERQPLNGRAIVRPQKKTAPSKLFELRQHSYQVSELCEIFGSSFARISYDLSMLLYMFCTLWGYTVVFGKALSSNIGITVFDSDENFLFYTMGFAVIVIPLSVMDVREQVTFQICMTVLRFAITFSMTGSVLFAWYTDSSELFPSISNAGVQDDLAMFNLSGLKVVLPSIFFALMINSSTPVVVHALSHKPHISWVVTVAIIIAGLMYGTIGSLVGGYFGTSVEDSCNVNWQGFGNGEMDSFAAVLTKILGFFIVLFPAMDVVSVYPLNVMVISSNLMAVIYHDRVDKAEEDRFIVTVFRLGCAIPPIVAALLLDSLTEIVDYAGCLALLIALVFPAYLNIKSQRACNETFGESKTPYTRTFLSRPWVCCAILILGLTLFAVRILLYAIEFYKYVQ